MRIYSSKPNLRGRPQHLIMLDDQSFVTSTNPRKKMSILNRLRMWWTNFGTTDEAQREVLISTQTNPIEDRLNGGAL